jgi:transcriptional regulator with XRE-family HTH domain
LPRKTDTDTNKASQNKIVQINSEQPQTKPKRTSKHSAANLPQSRAGLIQTEEDRQFVSTLLSEALAEYNRPRVKNDEELAERLGEYFERCATTGQVPTVEEMLLGTGFSHHYMNDIEAGRRKGFSPETATILKKAKAFMATFDAKLAVSGKMNFLAYCFRAKNYYGMVDKQEHVITPTTQDETQYNEQDMLKRYVLDDPNTIETTAEDA